MNYYKSITQILSLLFLFIVSSCNIEPFEGEVPEEIVETLPSTCEEAVLNTSEAGIAFGLVTPTDSNYAELCVAYKGALEDQITVCGDEGGAFQTLIDSIGDCTESVGDSDCSDATTLRLEAKNAFNSAEDSNYTSLCSAYKVALQNQIDLCGDEDNSLQVIIDELGDCVLEEDLPAAPRALMTANINGEQFDNLKPYLYPVSFASTVSWFSFASDAEAYLKIQGNSQYLSSPLPTSTKEINLLIPERDWKEGTFILAPELTSEEDVDGVTPHVHFINGLGVSDYYTESLPGSITITEFSLTKRIIKGEFEFTYKVINETDASEEGPFTVTGTFDYSLDDEYFD